MGEQGIADLMKVLIEDRKSRDAQFEEERKRQLQAAELEKAQMREQMEMLRKLVEDSRRTEETRTPAGQAGKEGEAKLVKLSEQDDIEAYLTTFERVMRAYEIKEERWAVKLAPYLTGKAQLAYAAMRAEDTGSYRCLKDAILRRYDISEETYRRRFREAVKKEEETVSELTVRLNDLLQKWTKECKTVEDIRDMMVQEQLLDALPRELKIWVAERKPKTSKEAAELADNYLRARKNEHRTEPSGSRQDKGSSWSKGLPGDMRREGTVNGRSAKNIMLDTGCSRTMVHRNLVSEAQILDGESAVVRCAHGDSVLYPMAEVNIEVDGCTISAVAAVSDTLPMDVLLGTDVPELGKLLSRVSAEFREQSNALVATTRARVRQEAEAEKESLQKQQRSKVRPNPVLPVEDIQPEVWNMGEELDGSIFIGGRERPLLSRSQKRDGRKQRVCAEPSTGVQVSMSAEELRRLQETDRTLEIIRRAVLKQQSENGVSFVEKEGLIYRVARAPLSRDGGELYTREQLVLPVQCRGMVMELAHSIPLAGHLGKHKTTDRVQQRFFWPTLRKDVADYCRRCEACQKTSRVKPRHAPLIPLPIMDEPFQKIAMDIVGPLPRSRSGNRYVLVICDYATRYPEAVPMRAVDAESVAEELVKMFARVGIPGEILTDQGSNFTSQLLTEMYRLLHIRPIRTTPYHPQTDGLVERFNQTLKSMLRKFATQKEKDWDKLIPYVLFAYREVRGPLDVLRESWVARERNTESVVSHVLAIRERMEQMSSLVKESLEKAQQSQKACPVARALQGYQAVDPRKDLDSLMSEFAQVLANTPGRTQFAEHCIETGSARPVRLPAYRIPHAYRETVRQEIEEMLEEGIIEHSNSEWSSPIVLVGKKDGSLRLCVDYRRLNSLSEADAYPMPRIDEMLDQLGTARFISTLDLTRGYWQVPVAKEARHKTAFVTPFGLYHFNVMPFGLQGAPATFQRLMDGVIREHLVHIREVLSRLQGAGLTAKPSKCHFGMLECTYLGHVVGKGVVQPEPSKVQAVMNFPIPSTKTQVRGFLGLTGYYRRFIPNYAAMVAILTDLTKKSASVQVQWSEQCNYVFEELKRILCCSPVLRSPDFKKPFVLQTDASDRGVGAVLSQKNEAGDDNPIAYFSKKLQPREERYSTIEKECLAIKLAMQAFRTYLIGRHFTVETDHRSLVWMDKLKDSNSRLTRWSLSMQPFNFTVVHRAGQANGNADALSRAPGSSCASNKFAAGEEGKDVRDRSWDLPVTS
eukprot:Em0013g782a